MTVWEDLVELFKFTLANVNRIDYVFPNAGIAESNYLSPTSTTEMQYVKPNLATIDVDLIGVLYTTSLAVQAFRIQPIIDGFRGKIVVTASIMYVYLYILVILLDCYSPIFPGRSLASCPGMPLYTTAKHGALGFIRSFASIAALDNITINGVGPNVTRQSFPKVGRKLFYLILYLACRNRYWSTGTICIRTD